MRSYPIALVAILSTVGPSCGGSSIGTNNGNDAATANDAATGADAQAADAAPADAGADSGTVNPTDPDEEGPFSVTTTSDTVNRTNRSIPVTAHVPDRGGAVSPLAVF